MKSISKNNIFIYLNGTDVLDLVIIFTFIFVRIIIVISILNTKESFGICIIRTQ